MSGPEHNAESDASRRGHGLGCGGCRELALIDASRLALSAIYDPDDPRDRAAEAEAVLRSLGIKTRVTLPPGESA